MQPGAHWQVLKQVSDESLWHTWDTFLFVVQLTKELEAGKARVEDEIIATVHIATGLEARLRQAKLEADLAQQRAQQADQRANQVLHCSSPSCLFTFCSSAFAVGSSTSISLWTQGCPIPNLAGQISQLRMLQCCCKVEDSCLRVLSVVHASSPGRLQLLLKDNAAQNLLEQHCGYLSRGDAPPGQCLVHV